MASPSSRRNRDQVKGTWTPEEDNQLRLMVQRFGPRNWAAIAEGVPGRTGKSCRLRWFNQLSPDLSQGPFTADEDAKLIAAHAQYGSKWSIIARKLPGRTDNSVKNRWNSALRRRGFTVGAPSEYNAPQVGDTPVMHSTSPASLDGSDPFEFQHAQGCQIFESNPIQFLDREPFAHFHESENAFSLSQPNGHEWPGESSTPGVGSFRAFNGDLNVNLFQRDPPPPTPLPQSLPPPPQQPLSQPDRHEWPGESSTQGVRSFRAFNGDLNVNLFPQDPPPPAPLPQSPPPPPQQPLSQPGGHEWSDESSTQGVRSFCAFNGGLNVNLFQQDPPPPTQPVAPLLLNLAEKIGPDTLLAAGGVTGHSTAAPTPPQQTLPPPEFSPPAAAMFQGGGELFNPLSTKEGALGLVISALTNKIKKRVDHQRMLIGGVRLMNYDENQTEDMANYIMNLAGINGAYKQHNQDRG